MKLITDIYLNKVFHLAKSWGVKMNFKISFFFNTSVKSVARLIRHLACHRWLKFQTELTF